MATVVAETPTRQMAAERSSATPMKLALLVAGCYFMEQLDGSIVTTSAPRIGADLGVSAASVGLIVTGYLLALAVFIPAGGWLMTLIRARTLFVGAITVFTLASLGCGLADSLDVITGLRVLQGVGGAMMVPVGRQLVLRDAPKSEMLRMVSYVVWPGLLAPVVAPLLGGLIVSHASWRWLFWINVPLGAIAISVAARLVPTTVEQPRTRLDVPGFLLVGVGLGGLIWAAHLIADRAGTLQVAVIVGALALLVCAAAVVHLRRTPTPLVELRVLGDRVFGLSQLGAFAFWMLASSIPFLLPLLLETSLHWSPVDAGALVMLVFIGNVGIKPATTPLLRRFGFRANLFAGTIGLTLTSAAFGAFDAGTPWPVIGLVALIAGVCRSISLTSYYTIGFSTISKASRRAANTLLATNQQLAAGLGVAVATVALRGGQSLAGTQTGQPAFRWAFLLVAALGLVSVVSTAFFPPGAGRELTATAAEK